VNLAVTNVSISLNQQDILHQVSIAAEKKELVGILGPNGSGKSTLLKSIYRFLKPDAGIISLNGENIYQLSSRQTARQMAVVRQESPVEFDFIVQEIVAMGRSPHKSLLERDTENDRKIIAQALNRVGMESFSERNYATLSGGEKQRVLIARALAQQAKIFVLDEPTNHLDIYYQLEIMDIVKTLNITVIAALHDLNIAAAYCDRLFVINAGKIVAQGTPQTVLNPSLIYDVFGVESEVVIHPVTDKPHIIFYSKTFKLATTQQLNF
jgi:iron complex transport system ATP-binding protein